MKKIYLGIILPCKLIYREKALMVKAFGHFQEIRTYAPGQAPSPISTKLPL